VTVQGARDLVPLRSAAIIFILNLVSLVYSMTAADYLRHRSTSVEATHGLILGWVALIGILSYLEAAVISKLVVRGGWRGEYEIREARRDRIRPWRDLHLPLTFAIATLLGINLLVFDQVAGGFFVDEQRANQAIMRMRSNDQLLRRDGIFMASRMHELRVRQELVRLIGQPGEERALAAWALGKIGNPNHALPLIRLLREGAPTDRGAAAIALGRLGQEQLVPEVARRLRSDDEPIESYVVALGLLADRHATLPVMEMMANEDTAPDHLALGAWTLGRIGDERACPSLVRLIAPVANPLTCASTFSLQRMGCDGSGAALIHAFESSSETEICDAYHFIDLDGRTILLWPSRLYRVALLEALARSLDEEVDPWLDMLLGDGSQVPQVRELIPRVIELRARDR
jgi:HEAT repeat protein